MAGSSGGGDHLRKEDHENSRSDESNIDISVLFSESNSDEQEKHKAKTREDTGPKAQTSTEENFTKPNVKSKTPDSKLQTKFFQALIDDRFEEFNELLDYKKVKLNYDYSKPNYTENGTCLEIASRLQDRSKYVKALLEFGVAPNVNEVLSEPIHYAAKYGNPETLEILLQDKRTNINAVDKDGRTALHLAVTNFKEEHREKYRKCITRLLNYPEFDINKPNKKGYTAIHEAASCSRELIDLFLKLRGHDLDLDSYKCQGRTAREFISDKYPELKRILPDTKQERQLSRLDIQLIRSLHGKKLEKFRKILQQIDSDGNARIDPNMFYGRPHNATCLEIACRKDECSEFVKLLLNAGADPNTSNPITKQTPLHLALAKGNHMIPIVLLKDRRINVNAVNSDGKSVLHIIAEWVETTDKKKRAIDILNLVLKRPNSKVKINLRDKCGQTATEIALRHGNKDFLEMMLTHSGTSMDLDIVMHPDNKTLREAILNKFPHLEEKLPIGRPTVAHDLITILFDHLYNGKINEFLEVLQQRNENADIDIDDGNYTLLQYAVLHGLEEPVSELLKADANPNKTTQNEKRPPVIIASQRKNNHILRILLETKSTIKPDVNATDLAGNTALHYASKNRDIGSVVSLLQCGAKILHTNLFGKPHLPADSIKSFLDESLVTNDIFANEKAFEIIFDYNFLLAYREKYSTDTLVEHQKRPLIRDPEANNIHILQSEKFPSETDFLHYLGKSYEYREIMEHPIITSFVHIKWLRVRFIYFINLLIYLLFAIFVNIIIIFKVGKHDGTNVLFGVISQCFIWIFLVYFGIIEIIQFSSLPKVYFKSLVNILDLALIFFTSLLAIVNYTQPTLVVIVILVSWTELMVMTSRFHRLSSNIEMLKEVITNYIWMLISFSYLLIAFGLSFYCVYHEAAKEEKQQRTSNNTENDEKLQFFAAPPLSILKTVVMMMGEFEANNLLTPMANNQIGFVLFILFVFLIPMVLFNLLTGVAVSDTHTIKANDHIFCLVSRIELIYDLEKTLLFLYRLTERLNSSVPKLVGPSLSLFEAILKHVNVFSKKGQDNARIHIRPNEFKNVVLLGRDHKTSSKLNTNILRKTLEIISDRYEQMFDDRESLWK